MYRIPIYRVQLVRDGSQKAERKKVSQPAVAAEVLWQFLEGADREHFVVVLLDTQNQIIGIHTVPVGMLDASLVHRGRSSRPRSCRTPRPSSSPTTTRAAIRRPPRRTAP
jgi:DNA repair protein RadC